VTIPTGDGCPVVAVGLVMKVRDLSTYIEVFNLKILGETWKTISSPGEAALIATLISFLCAFNHASSMRYVVGFRGVCSLFTTSSKLSLAGREL